MAIYHFSAQAISRSAGRSATGAAAYRAGELIVEERTGEVHDYTRKRGVLHAEILAPDGAPEWVFERATLWNRVEHAEKRKDAQVCREINIALPHELTSRQRLDLIYRYVKKNFVAAGMVADVCLHAPGKGENNKNFHAHILLTMRRLEGDDFGQKARDWNAVPILESWRKNWAVEANAALAEAGHDARIDHRSHATRGLDAVPGQHQGPAVSGLISRGDYSEVAERQRAERAVRELAQLAAQLAIARAQATAADAELEAQEAQERLQALAEVQAKETAQVERQRVQAEQAAQVERERQEAAQAAAKAAQVAQAERRQELDQARKDHQKAEQQVALAVQAESAAKAAVEQLQNARDWAVLGIEEAGKSLLKTTKALLKAPGWTAAVNAYDAAVEALEEASRAASIARQIVVLARGKVMELDTAERAARQAQKPAKVAAPAPQQATRAALVSRQVMSYQAQDEDKDDRGPAPGM